MSDLIGRMDKTVKFYRNTSPDKQAGGNSDAYTLLVTTRGELKTQTGGRSGAFSEISANNSYVLTVRKQNALFEELHNPLVRQGLPMKVTVNEKVGLETLERRFTIQSWDNLQEDYAYLRFNLAEQLL